MTAAQDPVVPIPEPPGRQIAAMIVGMTGVPMTAGRQLVSAVAARVALRPQIAEVRLVDERVPVPHVVQMIDTTAMSARNAPSVFANLIFLMRSRRSNSTSRLPWNCAPCPMDWLRSSLATWWRQISPCRTRTLHLRLSM